MVRPAALVLLLTFALAAASDAAALGASTHTAGFAVRNGVAYFTTDSAMCRTDGSRTGTRCFPGPALPSQRQTVLLNGKAYALFGWYAGQALVEFDGENAPRAVLQLPRNELRQRAASNGRHLFYFSAREIPDGLRLMRSDGTAGGTSLVRAIPTIEGSMLASAGDSILMTVEETATWKPRYDRALWTSDGTRDGTSLLVPAPFSSGVLARVNGTVLFRSERHLWRTDGTPAGTFVVAENVAPLPMSVREPFAYFAAGQAVWRTDGTHAAPFRTAGFQPYVASMVGSRLILIERRSNAFVVWSAEGADAAPEPVATIPGITSRNPSAITHAGPSAYIVLPVAGDRVQLWQIGGEPRTSLLGTFSAVYHLTPAGDKLVFFADDGVHGNEPWVSDGTQQGTMMLANLAPEGIVRGVVTDAATGRPIADAIVEGAGAVLRTDEDGRYELEGVIGRLNLQARTEQHVMETRELTVSAHEELTIDFALQIGARIAGRVTDSSGAPRTGYIVQMIPDAGTPLTLKTDTEGRFRTPPIPIAPVWTVRANVQQGHNAAVQTGLRLTAGETRGVELTMTPFGRVLFRMIDAVTGGPVRTTRFGLVRVYDTSGTAVAPYNIVDGSSVAVVLPDGEYQASTDSAVYLNRWLDGAACGSQSCALVRPAQRGAAIRCTGGTVTVADFVVTPQGGGVRGILVDAESGARVSRASVAVRDPTGAYAWIRFVSEDVFESEPIFPDRILTITVDPEDPAYLTSTVTVPMRYAENPHPEVKIELVRGGMLRGRVVDKTGKAIPGVTVAIAGRGGYTDAMGSYAIPGIAGGTYTVTATRHGYADARVENVVLTNTRKTTLNLTMQPK